MLYFIHVMLVPEKLGSFDPKPKTLWPFMEQLSELNSTVSVAVALGMKLKEQNFIDWLCCLNLEDCQKMFRKNGFLSLLGEGNRAAYLGRATEAEWKTWYQSNGMGKPVRQRFPLVSTRELLHCIPQYLCLCDRTEVTCKRGISGNFTFAW